MPIWRLMRPRNEEDWLRFYNTSFVINNQRWTLQSTMNLIFLNWRSMGGTRRVQQLKNLLQRKEVVVAFPCETNLPRTRMEWVKTQYGYKSMFVVDS